MIDVEYSSGDDVELFLGSRTLAGTVEKIEVSLSLTGLEHRVHVTIADSTIVCSPGQLQPV